MKSLISSLVLLCSLFGLPAVIAAQNDPYAQAVAAYVTAAGQELTAIRGQVDAETKDGAESVKQRFAAAYAALEKADALLEKLKKAEPRDFDRVKAELERARGETVKALEVARRGK